MSSILFKKKRRTPAGGGTTGNASSSIDRSSAPESNANTPSPKASIAESEDEDAGGPAVVVRRGQNQGPTSTLASRREKVQSASRDTTPKPTTGQEAARRTRTVLNQAALDEDEGEAFQLRRSKLSQAVRDRSSEQASAIAVDQATENDETARSRDGVQYTSAYLADLKASTLSINPPSQSAPTLSPSAPPMDIDTPLPETAIPSEQAVETAKQKRAYALGRQQWGPAQDDFISLDPSTSQTESTGASRLVRDAASDSDEYESFIADEQALGLSRKARKHNAEEQRKKISRALEKVHLDPLGAGDSAEEDDIEDEMAWEAAQLAKFQDTTTPAGSKSKHRPKGEEYVPAPVPEERPLPSLSAPHMALRAKLAEAKSRLAQRQQLIDDAHQTARALDAEREANRTVVETAASKHAYFADLNVFVKDLDNFLAVKFPLLLDLEREMVAIARTETARAIQPHISLLDQLVVPDTRPAWLYAHPDFGPEQNGYHAIDTDSQRQALRARWEQLWSDVGAPEFRSPVAGLPDSLSSDGQAPRTESTDVESSTGSQSFVGRFASWRARYPDEYMAAWGGLSLAQAWAFWARSDVLLTLLTSTATERRVPDAQRLLGQPWLAQARTYANISWPPQESTSAPPNSTIGGDEEVVQVLLREAILVPLANLLSGHVPDESAPDEAPKGTWNPWDQEANRRLGELLVQVVQAGAQASDSHALALIALDQVQEWTQVLQTVVVCAGCEPQLIEQIVILLVNTWPWLSLLLAPTPDADDETSQASAQAKTLLATFDSLIVRFPERQLSQQAQNQLRSIPAALACLPQTQRLMGSKQ